jgi:hypothetical protein
VLWFDGDLVKSLEASGRWQVAARDNGAVLLVRASGVAVR